MRTLPRLATPSAALLFALVATGCAERYIPNTDVVDTDDNREIVGFCETYRRAVERRDANALLGMVSPDYYEDGGNADASDDMDYAQFKAFLLGQGPMPAEGAPGSAAIAFVDAAAIRHEIRYRRVLREHERVFVDYTYSASYRIPTEKGEDWKRKVEDNRLELVKDEAGTYRIVAGM
jgi:hypothetical protein